MDDFTDPAHEAEARAATDEALLDMIGKDLAYVSAGYRYEGHHPSTSDIDDSEIVMDQCFKTYAEEVARRGLAMDVNGLYLEAVRTGSDICMGYAPGP